MDQQSSTVAEDSSVLYKPKFDAQSNVLRNIGVLTKWEFKSVSYAYIYARSIVTAKKLVTQKVSGIKGNFVKN